MSAAMCHASSKTRPLPAGAIGHTRRRANGWACDPTARAPRLHPGCECCGRTAREMLHGKRSSVAKLTPMSRTGETLWCCQRCVVALTARRRRWPWTR